MSRPLRPVIRRAPVTARDRQFDFERRVEIEPRDPFARIAPVVPFAEPQRQDASCAKCGHDLRPLASECGPFLCSFCGTRRERLLQALEAIAPEKRAEAIATLPESLRREIPAAALHGAGSPALVGTVPANPEHAEEFGFSEADQAVEGAWVAPWRRG